MKLKGFASRRGLATKKKNFAKGQRFNHEGKKIWQEVEV
jgi:hypothetical protein